MFEKFTEKAIKVIMLAQEEARRLGHSFIGTEELLLGLIGQRSGIAAQTLSQLGINLKQARQAVESLVGRGSGYQAIELPFTERAKNSLEFALEESRQLNCDTIDTEHLLLGLLYVEDMVANTILQNLGVDLSDLRSRLVLAVVEGNATTASTELISTVRLTEQIAKYSFDQNITARLGGLPDSPNPDQPGLKECLIELKAAIMDSSELVGVDRVDALAQIRLLAEAGRKRANSNMQRNARLAIKVLRGTIAILPLESPLAEVGNRCLRAIAKQFNLN